MKSLALETFYGGWVWGKAGGLPKVEVGHLLGAPDLHLATGPKAAFHAFDKYLWIICSVLGITRVWRRAGKERHGDYLSQVMDKERDNFEIYIVSNRGSVANDRTCEPIERGTGWTS